VTAVHLLNLTLNQLFALAAAGIVFVGLLYFESKFHRKQEVSSLQFWAPLAQKQRHIGRKRIQDWPSLLLQSICLLALVFALAQPEWGRRGGKRKSHLLLLDTSSWTSQESVLDREKVLVRKYVSTLPASDEVMLTRVDGLVVPLTPFTADRDLIKQQLNTAAPSLLALDLDEMLSFARQTVSLSLSRELDVTYIGPARLAKDAPPDPAIQNFKTLLLQTKPDHCGISHVGLAQDGQRTGLWKMTVSLRNYGPGGCDVTVKASLAGADLPAAREHLDSGKNAQTKFSFDGARGGTLAIALSPEDGLLADHHVTLELPSTTKTKIIAYTSRPELFRNLMETVPDANVLLKKPEDYQPNFTGADLIILDRIPSAVAGPVPTLWIAPGGERSPFQTKTLVVAPKRISWNTQAPATEGLHNEGVLLPSASVYQVRDGDTPLLRIPEGPIVVLRSASAGEPRRAMLGFDPVADNVRYEVTTPLLFLNLVRWLTAQSVVPTQIAVDHAGAAQIDLAGGEALEDVQVIQRGKTDTPLVDRDRQVLLFAVQPVALRYFHQGQKQELRIALPEIAEKQWHPAASQLAPLRSSPLASGSLWRWFIVLGLVVMFLEWWLFGKRDLTLRGSK
jgi:Aerotolerance regulator N-terminal